MRGFMNFRGLWVAVVIAMLMALSCTSAFAAVTGTITNSSGRAGWAYVSLKGTDNSYGTVVKFVGNATQPFTVNGLPDGTYSVSAWLDTSGTGIRHEFDPFVQGANEVSVTGGTGVTETLIFTVKSVSGITKPAAPNVYPSSNGVIVRPDWKLPDGLVVPEKYKLVCGTKIIDDIPGGSSPLVYILLTQGTSVSCTFTPKFNNIANTTYTSTASAAFAVSYATCAAAKINTCTTGYAVNGKVSFPGIVTSQNSYLLVMLTNTDKPADVPYTALVNSFANYSTTFNIPGVPKGEYRVRAFLDVDGNSIIGSGDAVLPELNIPSILVDGKGIDEAGTVTVPDMTLNSAGSVARVATNHDFGIYGDPGNPESYGLNFTILDAEKVPVAVELQNLFSTPAVSLARSESGGFFYKSGNLSVPPYVGDTYDASVTYSDGTTETRSMRVNAVLDDFALPTLVSGNVRPSGTAQMLAWHAPRPAPSYLYSYRTTLAGIESPEMKSSNLSRSVPVTSGQAYSWIVSLLDSLGNSAFTLAGFTTQASGPSISSFTPVTGPAGTAVTVNGSGFGIVKDNVTVSFNGTTVLPADIASLSDSQIVLTVPAEASTGPVMVTVSSVTAISSTVFTPTISYSGTIKDVNGTTITTAKVRKIGNQTASIADTGSFTLAATGYSEPDTAISAGVPFELKIFDGDATPTYRTSYTPILSSLANVTGAAIELVKDLDLNGWALYNPSFSDVKNNTKGMIRGQLVADIAGTPVSGATVSIKSRLYPEKLPADYFVHYGDAAAPYSPVPDSTTTSSGYFYVVGIDEGDVITTTASATNGFSFAPAAWQVRAGTVSQGVMRGDMDPAYVSVTATPPAGAYNEPKNVTLSASSSATVYYTTNDTDPRLQGTRYSGAIPVDKSTRITYVARNSIGKFGTPDSAYYYINTAFTVRAVPPGSIAPVGGGTYNPAAYPVNVAFKPNRDATVYYTTNGADPTNSPYSFTVAANSYTDPPVVISGPATVKFYAVEVPNSQSQTAIQSWEFLPVGGSAVVLTLKDSYGNAINDNGAAYGVVTATATLSPSTTGSVLFIVDGKPRWPKIPLSAGKAVLDLAGLPALGSSHTIQANYYNDAGSQTANSSLLSITSNKALFMPLWDVPADITYGTPLSHFQLNARLPDGAPLTGTFIYSPPHGTIVDAPKGTLSAIFVPDDGDSFHSVQIKRDMNVLKATPTVNWSKPADIVYGTALSPTQLNARLVGYDGNPLNSNCTYKLDSGAIVTNGTILSAGNHALSVSCSSNTFADFANYDLPAINSDPITITVTKAPLTVSAVATREYGEANPSATAVYTGFADGDNAANVVDSIGAFPVFYYPSSTILNTKSNAGRYVITVDWMGPAPANYYIVKKNGTITVTKAPITVTADNKTRLYGKANPAFTATFTASDFKNGQVYGTSGITGLPSFTTTAAPDSPPGGDYDIIPSLGTLTATNYYFDFTNGNGKLTVSKNDQKITFAVLPTKGYGMAPFGLTATASSGLPITYSSDNESVVTVSGSTVTIVGIGTANITATQSGDGNYNAASAVKQLLTVGKGPQTINFSSISDKLKTDAPFVLSATASSGLPVGFSVFAGGTVATVSESTVTLRGIAGRVTIRASQSGDTNYNATYVDRSFYVKSAQTITFNLGANATKTYGAAAFYLNAISDSKLAVTYISSNPAVAAVVKDLVGTRVTIKGAGSTTITAYQAGSTVYAAATPVEQTLVVNKKSQAITFATLASRPCVNNGIFTLAAAASSKLPVSYTSSNPAVAEISGRTVIIKGAGTTTITASQAGNANYEAASDVPRDLLIAQGTQTINFPAVTAKSADAAAFDLNATASSGLDVSYSVESGPATVSGKTITLTGSAGAVKVKASQDGNANYSAADPKYVTFNVIASKDQTIGFSLGTNSRKTFGNAAFTITASSTSLLPVTFASENPAVATVSGSTVTIRGAGTAQITATQAGNAYYKPASPVSRTLTVNKANQNITFGLLPAKVYGKPSFKLAATASSKLQVTYTSSDTTVATISENVVTIVGAGKTTITATQSGNGNYNAALPVPRTLTVNKASQTITFVAIGEKSKGAEPFDLSASSSSGLPLTYSIVSGPATISGDTVSMIGITGTVTVKATQVGDDNYSAAFATQQFVVKNKAQVITFNALDAKTYGDAAFKLTATSDSGLAVTYTSSNPAVATLSNNTITIKGAGVTTITARQAGNSTYAAASPVPRTLSVNKKPLTYAAVNNSKTYNSINPALTYKYSGFAYGQTLLYSGVKGVPKLTTTAVKASPIGIYPITVELNTLYSKNYSFNLVDGTLSVVLP